MKSGKWYYTDGMELPNQNKIRTLGEKETYKYLVILTLSNKRRWKKKSKEDHFMRTRKLLETNLCSRNLIKGINTWAVPLVRYSGPFLKWTREEIKQMGQRTRKLMTMHQALPPRDEVDRFYVSKKKEGERGLASTEDKCWRINTTTWKLHWKAWRKTDYSQQKQYWQYEDQQNDNNGKTKMGRKATLLTTNKWHITQENMGMTKKWKNLKRENESLLITAQNNAIRTTHIKARIDKTQQNSKYRLCRDREENINHIISEHSKLTQKEYKTRYNWVGNVIHWELCKKFKFDHTNKWYMQNITFVR